MLGKKLTLAAAGNNQQAGAGATDADFASTTLLLQGDTSNTSVNYNAFGDTSGNNVDLAPTGFTKGSSFTPYGTSWSNDFDGSGSYLNVSHSSSFTLDGSFTIEMWVNFSSQSQGYWDSILSIGKDATSSASGNGLTIYHMDSGSGGTDGGIAFQVGGTGNRVKSGSIRGTGWRHVAATRDGSNVCRLFIDGVGVGTSIVVSTSINSTEFGARIGLGDAGSSNYYDGYISNLRIVKGSALYTSNFTPSTTPLTAVSGTSLLTCNSNRFIDTSSNAHTITVNGTPKVKGFSPLAETNTTDGGMFNNGDQNSFAKVTGDSAVALGSGDYCVEMWLYDSKPSKYTCPVDTRPGNPSGLGISIFLDTGNELEFFSGSSVQTGYTFPSYEWAHLAIVRQSGTVKLYVNGVQKGSVSETSNHSNDDLYIGNWFDYTAADYSFDGYIADFRITKGSPVYTTTFTPPSTPLTAVSGTSLLTLQKRGSVRNTKAFNDSAAPARVITANGNVTQGSFSPFSVEEGKWGVDLSQTDGAHLRFSDSTSLDLSGEFTIELWHKQDNYGSNNSRLFQRGANSLTGYCLLTNTNGTVKFGRTDEQIVGFNQNLNDSQWHHFAVTRDGSNTVRLYFDGVLKDSATMADNLNQSGDLFIGHYPGEAGSSNNRSNGQFSNFRLVTGSALYTGSSFTPSTTPLTAVSGTQILALQSNRFVNNSGTGITVTAYNYPVVIPSSPFAPTAAYSPSTKGGSAYVDDSGGDYLTLPSNTPLTLNSSSWTVDFWMYPTSYVNGQGIWGASNGGGQQPKVAYQINSSSISLYVQGQPTISATAPTLNEWTHVLISRHTGGNGYIYYNGQLQTSGSVGTSTVSNPFQWFTNGEGGTTGMRGYLSCGRVSDIARHTGSNFSIPTALPTLDSDTVLLCNFTDAGIFDGTVKNVVETIGDVRIVNDVKKYGTGAMYFDGTNDSLIVPSSLDHEIEDNDFTIEFWANASGPGTNVFIAKGIPGSSANSSWWLETVGGYMSFYISSGSGYANFADSALWSSYSGWVHVAGVVDNRIMRMYINGVQKGSADISSFNTNNSHSAGTPITIGDADNQYPITGYLDDIRITKGVCRYPNGTTFTPPSEKLPNQ